MAGKKLQIARGGISVENENNQEGAKKINAKNLGHSCIAPAPVRAIFTYSK